MKIMEASKFWEKTPMLTHDGMSKATTYLLLKNTDMSKTKTVLLANATHNKTLWWREYVPKKSEGAFELGGTADVELLSGHGNPSEELLTHMLAKSPAG